MEELKKNKGWKGRPGPVVLVIMDGVGFGAFPEGDAVADSRMDTFQSLLSMAPHTRLKAHGKAVGLPSDSDMGNSEVGHNAIGCGRVFEQGAALVSTAIQTGELFTKPTWKNLVAYSLSHTKTLHLIGLLSDGNVHSHITHLKALIEQAAIDGITHIFVHALLDGRDVPETSCLDYVSDIEQFMATMSTTYHVTAKIASGGGRMYITMDRYGADWEMVKRGWYTHVLGDGRQFESATEAIQTYRKENPAVIDQDLHEFVIAENGKPVGAVNDGDAVVFFNFRGDRALEITKCFETKTNFTHFDRKRFPDVFYAGMMEYDGDLKIPTHFLVSPPEIDRTMSEYLCASGVKQLAISETQKYGHVTYFFNGNRIEKFDERLETYIEIPSDLVPFEQRPWMKCAEITDTVITEIERGEYSFIRLNYPNGDMVGHTGVYQSVICSMEALDIQLGRLKASVEKAGGILLITADHGNADDMYEHAKDGSVKLNEHGRPKAKTSHSLNPVPFIVYDPAYKGEYKKELKQGLGIASIAATVIELLGFVPPADYCEPIISMEEH